MSLNWKDKKEETERQVHMLLTAQEIFDLSKIDLKYDNGYLAIISKENPKDRVTISKEQLDAKRLEREENTELRRLYTTPTEITETTLQGSTIGQASGNSISYDPKKVSDTAAEIGVDENIFLTSVLGHEQTHINDHKTGLFKTANISDTYMQKLNMCTEINATITQASQVLDEYEKTHNPNLFKQLAHCSNWKDIQQYTENHLKDKNLRKQVGKMVFEGWLNRNNQEGTDYARQALNDKYGPNIIISDRQAGALVDNQATLNEYHKRTDKMFKNTALGDIRDLINVDFDVAYQTEPLQSEQFLQIITDSKNVHQATKQIKTLYEAVKEADEDGIRTTEEQEKIERTMAKLIAQKTGRGRSSSETHPNSSKSTKVAQIQVYRGR